MKAAILSVGDEILRGETTDTNASVLGAILGERGVEVVAISVVGDSAGALRDRLRSSLSRADLVCVTGGLGPTRDDITREAIAEVLGKGLVLDPPSKGRIRARFTRRGRKMSPNNEKQALFPVGAEIIDNPVGTAPGFICRHKGSVIIAMPGVPFEMENMAAGAIQRALEGADPGPVRARRTLAVVGLPESEVDERLGSLMDRGANPLLGLRVTQGEIQMHLLACSEGDRSAEDLLDDAERRLRALLGEHVQMPGGPRELLTLLEERGWKLATAESCTGGLIADRITDVPGASRVFAGGAVAYTPRMKVDLLGVAPETLEREGEVSESVAREMAQGACARSGAEVGIGVTGVAGPGGGTPKTPVGRVCMGVRHPGGFLSRTWEIPGTRRRVKETAAAAAIRTLCSFLREEEGRDLRS